MDPTVEEIQTRYIAALRALRPALDGWWSRLVAVIGEPAAYRRWPTGASGHPALLSLFRDYYFQIADLNDRAEDEFEERSENSESEDLWGEDEAGAAPRVERQVDHLIRDIEMEAPDVYLLVAGLVFVPVGLDADEEVV